jgi:UDP-N-acetylmuramate dehydrogenase
MPADQKYIDFAAVHPKVEMGVALSAFSSMGIGGPADLYYRLEKTEDLEPLIKTAERLKIPYFVLGGGTNTVFADEGFRGLVIHFMARKVALEPANDDNSGAGEAAGARKDPSDASSNVSHKIISADAGALLSQIIAFALKNNLAGLEKLMGLPGTIGGAVRGNAGAHGTEIKDVFYKALIYSPEKGLFSAGPEYFNFSYRHSTIKHSKEIILKVFMKLEEKDCTEAIKAGTEIVTNRITAQPKGRSTGSFFKNPGATSDSSTGKETKAGYLLEQCGCKGLTVGGAQVSPEHANWIMNTGKATQKDLLELAQMMRNRVLERFNITLDPEVQLIGATGPIKL